MELSRAVSQDDCQLLPHHFHPFLSSPSSTRSSHRHIPSEWRVCVLAPGNQHQGAKPRRLLPRLRLLCLRPCSRGGGRKALGRPWLQPGGGNQISRWERLGCWSRELSAELSLSLLNQSGTKAEPAPKQQGHCLLAGTAAFWVRHAG